jgi:hypothetical protein
MQKVDITVSATLVERNRRMLLQCARLLTRAELIDEENARESYEHKRLPALGENLPSLILESSLHLGLDYPKWGP